MMLFTRVQTRSHTQHVRYAFDAVISPRRAVLICRSVEKRHLRQRRIKPFVHRVLRCAMLHWCVSDAARRYAIY